jgi:hypothetical protein
MATKKKCPCENTFNSGGDFEKIIQKIEKGKILKPFPTYGDAEMEAKQVPRAWGK